MAKECQLRSCAVENPIIKLHPRPWPRRTRCSNELWFSVYRTIDQNYQNVVQAAKRHEVRSQIWEEDLVKGNQIHVTPLKQGFFTWGASTLSGCWNQFQGVLGRSNMWRKKVKGIRLWLLYPCSNQMLANGRGWWTA